MEEVFTTLEEVFTFVATHLAIQILSITKHIIEFVMSLITGFNTQNKSKIVPKRGIQICVVLGHLKQLNF